MNNTTNNKDKPVKITLVIMIALGIAGTILTLAMKQPAGGVPGQRSGLGGSGTAAQESVMGSSSQAEEKTNPGLRVNGDITAEENVAQYSDVAGKLTGSLVSVGDHVKAGQVIARVDPSRPGDIYSVSPVYSTITGTVTEVNVHTGDTVGTTTPLVRVGKLASLQIRTRIPERYVNSIVKGQQGLVTLEAFPGENFAATVAEISPVLDPASRTMVVKFRFDSNDTRIKAGMFATVTIPLEGVIR
jgi:multidrug efflux pump subunit AcrA (membrane-fusion protein)